MDIFSIFKRRKTETSELTPVAILRLTQEYVPEFYKESEKFKESKDFLKHNEWGLSLETLIEMADESGHYFSEDFWLDLATCADKMEMIQQAEFCRKQIIKNEKEIGKKTPKGWTTIKIDDTHFENQIAEIVKDNCTTERHQKDKFNELVKDNGFHIKYHGRAGMIYYIDNGKVLEIDFEMSGVRKYDILLFFDTLRSWTIPKNEPFAFGQQSEIRDKLLKWLKSKRIKSDLE
ncbi:hypothetical protein VB776_02545 [Arcicella sp. DC2W]|uniref:Uncharacterized protein n=1 Tax=Arcicella gelida TaxID=2984195 RepID=A0ABU5S023_9BACT|nr:hypothetical protein [Arcicella sp. DC2W]MEA5401777.1 hypothetical protein [Arcicella sp. DC2W]